MNTKEIMTSETSMMENLRQTIEMVVSIRLQVMKLTKQLKKCGIEVDVATEDMVEAIELLQDAETSMGNAHQNLLVSHATLKHENDTNNNLSVGQVENYS